MHFVQKIIAALHLFAGFLLIYDAGGRLYSQHFTDTLYFCWISEWFLLWEMITGLWLCIAGGLLLRNHPVSFFGSMSAGIAMLVFPLLMLASGAGSCEAQGCLWFIAAGLLQMIVTGIAARKQFIQTGNSSRARWLGNMSAIGLDVLLWLGWMQGH